MEFRVLGPVEVRVDGRTIDIGPRLQRRLLALLVLNVNRVVPAEVILEALWGDEASSKNQDGSAEKNAEKKMGGPGGNEVAAVLDQGLWESPIPKAEEKLIKYLGQGEYPESLR